MTGKLPVFCLLLALSGLSFQGLAAERADCVVLLHGLARSAKAMEPMAKALEHAGYLPVNTDYPSRYYTIEELSALALPAALAVCDEHQAPRIHVVTHSMGGILLRQYLQSHTIDKLGRVVMLGPPNQGSQVVDQLKDTPGFAQFNGPAGLQLGTGDEDLPPSLTAVNFDLGVVAGSRSINWILSSYLPNPDDGKVSVENTRVEGMCAHWVVPVSHPFLMKDAKVIQQTLAYLAEGEFGAEGAEKLDCPGRKPEDALP